VDSVVGVAEEALEVEVAAFVKHMARYKHGIGYLYMWLATVALYAGWFALYSTLSLFGGPLSPYAWLTWIPVVALMMASATCAYSKLKLEEDPVLSATGPVRAKVFGACFSAAYSAATAALLAAGAPPRLSRLIYSMAWMPALASSWILVGLLAEGREVEEGYLPQRISLRMGLLTAASLAASLAVATALHRDVMSDAWYWTFHGCMCFSLVLVTVLALVSFTSKVAGVEWLVRERGPSGRRGAGR